MILQPLSGEEKKLLTAALASWNTDLIGDSTLKQYDFINIMSYDKTGRGHNTSRSASPFSMVKDDFNYFTTNGIYHLQNFSSAFFLWIWFGTNAQRVCHTNKYCYLYRSGE